MRELNSTSGRAGKCGDLGRQPRRARAVRWLSVLVSSLTVTAAAAGQDAYTINYRLNKPGQVSVAVYAGDGRLVRTLAAAEPQPAGARSINWDGTDDDGDLVPDPAACTWKLLRTDGLKAKYLMTIGPTFPLGKEWWEHGPGEHNGPRSVAVDQTGVYVAAGIVENARNAIKMDPTGTKCLWSAGAADAWQGRYSMSVMRNTVLFLAQNGKLYAHPADKPNRHRQDIAGKVGFSWDAKYPGDKDGKVYQWHRGPQTIDMAAHDAGAPGPQVVISYQPHDAVQWRDPETGTVLATAKVPAPKGVAIDNAGNVLVISEDKILQIDRDGKTKTIADGLTDPHRLDVDRSNGPARGDIYVTEIGDSQQVKRLSATGRLKATYGQRGGRGYGLYKPESFLNVVDIASDRQGGFYAVEATTPRRLVRFGADGRFAREWYGGTHWVPSIYPDPADPGVVWMSYEGNEIMRVLVDYKAKAWRIHSTYKISGLAGGMIQTRFPNENAGLGGGYGDWHPRRRPGDDKTTYLVRRNFLQVVKVDETDWTLKPLVVGKFGSPDKKDGFIWTDADGDGQPQESEYRRLNWGEWGFNTMSLQAPVGFDYVRFNLKEGKIYEHPVDGWNEIGAPIYRPLNEGVAFNKDAPDRNGFGVLYDNPPGYFGRETPDGPLYMAFNGNPQPGGKWGNAAYTKMTQFGPDGRWRWDVGRHVDRPPGNHPAPPPPGAIFSFKNVVGVVRGVVVATDFNGGWEGKTNAITYAWDADGLYVGGLFANPDKSAGLPWQYTLATDNGSGAMHLDPRTNVMTYFGCAENEARIYEITGWSGWDRQSGRVTPAAAARAGR